MLGGYGFQGQVAARVSSDEKGKWEEDSDDDCLYYFQVQSSSVPLIEGQCTVFVQR
jgi:hypothetical protein